MDRKKQTMIRNARRSMYPTQAELARRFGVSPKLILHWVKMGCPFLNFNPAAKQRRYRFDEGAVIAWLSGKEVEN